MKSDRETASGVDFFYKDKYVVHRRKIKKEYSEWLPKMTPDSNLVFFLYGPVPVYFSDEDKKYYYVRYPYASTLCYKQLISHLGL